MHFLFVCTGNQCRSLIGEYYMRGAIGYWLGQDAGISVSSAGTMVYPPHPADPKVVALLRSNGIDASGHRSTVLTADLMNAADLVLCFEQKHLQKMAALNPSAVRKAFLFSQFAYSCAYMSANALISGDTPVSRLASAIDNIPLALPFLPQIPAETEDPHGKSDEVFHSVYAHITGGINTIVKALKQ